MLKRIIFMMNKNNRSFGNKDINMEELKKLQRDGAIIIDVRSKQEFNEGHLDNAILLPYYEINKKKIFNMFKDLNKGMVLYCSTGSRSKKAQRKLNYWGYNNVYNLYGGIEEY